jgi:hypothetical protein
MAVSIISTLARLSTYRELGNVYHSLNVPTQRSLRRNRFQRIQFIVDPILMVASTICIELGLYYGALHGWRSTRTISFFAASSEGCLSLLTLRRSWRSFPRRRSVPSKPFEDSNLWIAALIVSLGFSWGVGYYTFIHYLRKFMCRSISTAS